MTGRYFDLRSTVLVVVGHGILAEEEDRPGAGSSCRWRKRAALRGMDQAGTREAVDVFVMNGLLERFLDLVWRETA